MTAIDTSILIKAEDLVPGTRYSVSDSDCCLSISLVGTFLRREPMYEGSISEEYTFDFGTITGNPTFTGWPHAASGENPTPG